MVQMQGPFQRGPLSFEDFDFQALAVFVNLTLALAFAMAMAMAMAMVMTMRLDASRLKAGTAHRCAGPKHQPQRSR